MNASRRTLWHVEDNVDRIQAQWKRERPDLDTSAMGIVGRVSRLSRHFERELRTTFREHGLEAWEFDVLATLRRAGAPYELKPTALLEALMVTSGAVTNRIDQLTSRGLVYRKADPNDRRGSLVGLTAQGLHLVDEVAAIHVRNQTRIVSALAPDDRPELARMLRELLLKLEPSSMSGPTPVVTARPSQ
jgi:DNA-binding MarR family transcriptional regulator